MARMVMTKDRQQLIKGLQKAGGEILAPPGEKLNPEELKKKLGLKTNSLAGLLARAERDGLIARDMNGRRTLAVRLVGNHIPAPAKAAKATATGEAPAKRSYTRRSAAPEMTLPFLGEQVTVCSLSRNRDGNIQMAIRNDSGSWMMTVDGYAAAE